MQIFDDFLEIDRIDNSELQVPVESSCQRNKIMAYLRITSGNICNDVSDRESDLV